MPAPLACCMGNPENLSRRGDSEDALQLNLSASMACIARSKLAVQNECRRLLQELLHSAALQTSNISAAYQSGSGVFPPPRCSFNLISLHAQHLELVQQYHTG